MFLSAFDNRFTILAIDLDDALECMRTIFNLEILNYQYCSCYSLVVSLTRGGGVLRTFILLSLLFFCCHASTEIAQKHAEPEQNFFVNESPKPQGLHEVQTRAEFNVGPRNGNLSLDAGVEYGVTRRFWLGPNGNFSIDNGEEIERNWQAALGAGFNIINDEFFLLSLLLSLGYGSEQLSIAPTLALFKAVGPIGIDLGGTVTFHPMKTKTPDHEITIALFTNMLAVSPMLEGSLEVRGEEITPKLVPGILFLNMPNMEVGIGAELPIPHIDDMMVMISLVKEF